MEECPICFGDTWITKSPCNHTICLSCLLKLEKDECPYCRKPIYYSFPPNIKNISKINPFLAQNTLNINNYEEFPSLSANNFN